MSDLEQLEYDLRRDLRHVPAPAGFADRVLARTARRQGRRFPSNALNARAAWWAAAAATLLLAGSEGRHLYRLHEAKQAQAQAQLTLAMTLTNHALQAVQRDVDRSPAGRYTRVLQDNAAPGDGR